MNREAVPTQPIEVEATSGAFMLVRRTAVEEVGMLDEGYFMHCEDLDWCWRFRQAGWKVLFVPQARVVHKKGRSSRTMPIEVELYKHLGMLRFYRKFLRHRYPVVLMWAVTAAVWIRFAAKATVLLLAPSLGADYHRPARGAAGPPPLQWMNESGRGRCGELLVLGATSQVGFFLVPLLAQRGMEVER